MPHWIITNRAVVEDDTGRERVLDPDNEADRLEGLPVFRVATFEPPAPPAESGKPVPEGDALEAAVEFVPDAFIDRYDRLRAADANDLANLAGSRRMFRGVYDQMSNAPAEKGDTLFFIHGFNYSWRDALDHLYRLHRVYVENPTSPINTIMYFSWPGWGSLRRYRSDQEIALPAGQNLGRLFEKTLRFFREFFGSDDGRGDGAPYCGRKIHLAAHSMGNQVLEQFAATLFQRYVPSFELFGEVLLLNADADWSVLEPGKPMFVLPEISERLHVYNHYSDDALRVSEWTKNREKRLGRSGPRDIELIPPRTTVVDCSKLAGAGAAGEADDAFVSTAASILGRDKVAARERAFDHWGYMNRPEVIADVCRVLRGTSAADRQFAGAREHRGGPLYRLLPTA